MGALGPWTLGTMGPLEPYGTFGTCEKLCEGKLCEIVKQLKTIVENNCGKQLWKTIAENSPHPAHFGSELSTGL